MTVKVKGIAQAMLQAFASIGFTFTLSEPGTQHSPGGQVDGAAGHPTSVSTSLSDRCQRYFWTAVILARPSGVRGPVQRPP